MSTPVAVSAPPRLPAARRTPSPVSAQVIDVDVRQPVLDARATTRAVQAARLYADHGTALLGDVQAPGPRAQAGRHDAGDGWSLVGHWLTLVAVLSVCAVALAWFGDLTAR